ncbi:MAG: tRNA (cytidine(34)-2'-O)-methyltransferase [Proteobacteria bacterium]|nr:tRNA (cytidine(34)-2'-O)-methyltransferase [Pseudomonadota bacterium]MBU1612234.1 tRNA (cytidine(34)-2'-O)-methyltransferase [Pseudomonadota bacterium]
MQLVLFEPEIPPNAGNVARLCAATKIPLHFIEPLGFKIDDKHLKRAGLDYWPNVNLTVHVDFNAFRKAVPGRLVLTSARSGMVHCDFAFEPGDLIVLGPETRGLPDAILAASTHRVRIPTFDTVRSLNMSTAAGILLFEGLRQTDQLPAPLST